MKEYEGYLNGNEIDKKKKKKKKIDILSRQNTTNEKKGII